MQFPPLALLRSTRSGRGLLTLVALASIGSAGILGTNAAFSDDVTMASITVTGGSLDLEANETPGDSGVSWGGSLVADVGNMAPGDVAHGTVKLDNEGSLPFTLDGDFDGTDASGCFGYTFREGASTYEVGTGSTTDAGVVGLGTDSTNVALAGDGAGGVWAKGGTKSYTLSVRMLDGCTTNAAGGSLAVSFHAAQA